MNLTGIHHLTAMASDPQRNLDFYAGVLGLRLVKKTVNFDDPNTYHLYYGDRTGTPGTIPTFFPWVGAARGRVGAGSVRVTSLGIPQTALGFWMDRLTSSGVAYHMVQDLAGARGLEFSDPDGMVLRLVPTDSTPNPDSVWPLRVAAESAIRGIVGVEILVRVAQHSTRFLEALGFTLHSNVDGSSRYVLGHSFVDVVADLSAPRTILGAGSVHHVAFRIANDDQQKALLERLHSAGVQASPVMDRTYFHSIYFREPGGVLFEVATDAPGFVVDELEAELGQNLKLPEQYEDMRATLEASLVPLIAPQ